MMKLTKVKKMNSEVQFAVFVLVTVSALLLVVFKFDLKAIMEYFKTKDGKGILKGIVLAIVFAVGLAIYSSVFAEEKGEWFSYGEVYFGVDQTFGVSPQCIRDGVNDKLTSNIGLKANIYRSFDKKFEANAKYTHHSCAINSDRNGYDGIGIELTYRLWGN